MGFPKFAFKLLSYQYLAGSKKRISSFSTKNNYLRIILLLLLSPMVFNSFHFLVFMLVVFGGFFLIPHRLRWIFLLAASYYFYMAWKAKYALLIVIITLIDYFCGIKLAEAKNKRNQKFWLLFSLISNLGILMVFKYYDFFIENINSLFTEMGMNHELPILRLILPLGISFHTFQSMAYTIDVYKKRTLPEKHLGYFALFIAYFPQMVAGPIERAGNVIHQLKEKTNFDYDRISAGFKLMIWGFFKKIVIADRLAVIVDSAYDNPSDHGGLTMMMATYAFAFQIYCDFSGYTDIAIGASKILGVNMMKNFKTPYLSLSISEFWNRWHISLSTWFKDYLYIPLGGNRKSKPRVYLNIMIVFLLSGFWHGAEWTFIIWGAIHGFYTISENLFHSNNPKIQSTIRKRIRQFILFNMVCIAWIFFRANDLNSATQTLYSFMHPDVSEWMNFLNDYGMKSILILGIIWISFIFLDRIIENKIHEQKAKSSKSEYAFYTLITALILIFGFFGKTEFIYFQF